MSFATNAGAYSPGYVPVLCPRCFFDARSSGHQLLCRAEEWIVPGLIGKGDGPKGDAA